MDVIKEKLIAAGGKEKDGKIYLKAIWTIVFDVILERVYPRGYDEVLASSGSAQLAATQHGIALIFIFAPVILVAFLFLFGKLFPMKEREFEIIKKEIARRKGEDASTITEEEKRVCEKVTGFKYEDLWNLRNTRMGS